MSDDVVGSWTIDDVTRLRIQAERVGEALEQRDWWTTIIEAEELLDQHPDHAESLRMLAEAMLGIADAEGAAQAYGQYLRCADDPDPLALAGLAVARFELCELTGCIEAAREAIRLAPDLAQAHFYLSLALERTDGRTADARAAFEEAHRLDPAAYPEPLGLTASEWSATVQLATAGLHATIRAFWEGVPIAFSDLPPLELLRASDPPIPPTVSALYEGTPPDEDETDTRPTRLVLYCGNLARAGTPQGVLEEVAHAMESEALHWLGWGPEDLA